MLKEEEELRKWIRSNVRKNSTMLPGDGELIPDIKRMLRMTTALVRAVREDCAKVADRHTHYDHLNRDDGCECADKVAAAIRGKKGRGNVL